MSVDNIVIPSGILATWDGPQSAETQRQGEDDESFDIVEVAREHARLLSVSSNGQLTDRRSTLERVASIIPPSQNFHPAFQQEFSNAYVQRSGFQRQRHNSINLGGLARSRATGRSTPANPGLRFGLAPMFQNRLDSTTATANPGIRFEVAPKFQHRLDSTTETNLEDSYLFRRLDNYKPSYQDVASQSSAGPLFLARESSVNTVALRRKSSSRYLERHQSEKSRLSSVNVARRASIVVGNVLEKVKDTVTAPLRRSSLQEVYEKAKIRQIQLKRSIVAQISFQYFSYLLMLAGIYFIFVGFPLWKGLVLVLFNVFHMQLAIPAGTAAFLGIAFL